MNVLLLIMFLVIRVFGDDVEIDVRIIGGNDASVGEFPYQASIRFNGQHYCGGSVIDETTILTAAHCLQRKNASYLTVALGNNHLPGGEVYKVERFIQHEKFDSNLVTNDIALIKLKTSIEYNDRIQPIVLGSQYIPAGVKCVVSGWGFTVVPAISKYLQKMNLITCDLQDCHDRNSNQSKLVVGSSNICTYTTVGEGTCIGDSGGPLVAHKHQIGIVSWSVGCALGMPEVYTRISSYIDWIEEHRH